MMYLWKPEMIKYMCASAEYCDYHKKLAELILSRLPANADIVEPGCGLGHLSMQLCKHAKSVTAIDVNTDAINKFIELSAENNGNLNILNYDINSYRPEKKFDAAVFNFFGKTEEILDISKRLCDGVVVIVKRAVYSHGFSLSSTSRHCEHNSFGEDVLQQKNIPHTCDRFDLEFGQPLYSLNDAIIFFKTYSREDSPEITEDLVKTLVISTGRADYPYYYPYTKKIKIITFNTRDLS